MLALFINYNLYRARIAAKFKHPDLPCLRQQAHRLLGAKGIFS